MSDMKEEKAEDWNIAFPFEFQVHFLRGPGKLLMFGVRENPKIRPQIRKVIALKSAHLDRAYYHVISQKGNYLDFASQSILRVEIGSLNYKNDTTNII